MKHRPGVTLFALAAVAASFSSHAQEASAPRAKNVIVLIADGCGFNHIAATDFFQYGEAGKQVYQQSFKALAMSTYSAQNNGSYDPSLAWKDLEYLKKNATDSAAAATTMSTGVKTYNSAIGVDVDKKPLKHAAEVAEEQGKSSGVVTTVPIPHATPAGFSVHDEKRGNYRDIALEMIVDSRLDVIMGAGHPWFDKDGKLIVQVDDKDRIATPQSYDGVGSAEIWAHLLAGTIGNDADGDGQEDRWTLIQTREAFQALADAPTTPKRVIGVAQAAPTLNQERSGDEKAAAGVVPLNANVPTLAEMSRGALNVLDNDPDGFFLMIEGGAVDWAGHDNQAGRMIEELIDFNRAVEAVVEWVEKHSNWDETLVIVTADHETGFLGGPDGKTPDAPVINHGAGNMPGMEWRSGSHTNSLVPFFAKGPGADLLDQLADEVDPVRGRYLDNTEMGQTIHRVLGAPVASSAAPAG